MRRIAKRADDELELFPAYGEEPAVVILVHPIGVKAVRAARRAVAKALGIDPTDIEDAGDEMSRELLRHGVYGWSGIGDDDDQPLAFTPEALEEFLADPIYFEVADRKYVLPWSRRQQEGNASPPSPAGTGVAATPASDIAPSLVPPSKTGAAKNARTSSASRKPRKASGYGKR